MALVEISWGGYIVWELEGKEGNDLWVLEILSYYYDWITSGTIIYLCDFFCKFCEF